MKKILAIAPYPYLPFYSGGQKFIAKFLQYLGAETELTVISVPGNDLSLATGYSIIPLLKKTFSRYYDLSLVKKLSEEIKKNHYDTVIWEQPYFAWLAVKIRNKTGVRTIIHTHNIEYQRFRSIGKWWWPFLRIYEKWSFKKADVLFFITPEDKAFAVNKWHIAHDKCFDLPFGVDIKEFPGDKQLCRSKLMQLHQISPFEKIILFNGVLNYTPNLEALYIILDTINPVLLAQKNFSYKIIICGKDLPATLNNLEAYKGKNIIYAGFVKDIETYFKGADLFLNPVQTGGGIKTKMVEAIAYGTTVIASESGAAGIIKDCCGNKLLVVKNNGWNNFTTAIIKNIATGDQTPATFYENYYWENSIKKIMTAL